MLPYSPLAFHSDRLAADMKTCNRPLSYLFSMMYIAVAAVDTIYGSVCATGPCGPSADSMFSPFGMYVRDVMPPLGTPPPPPTDIYSTSVTSIYDEIMQSLDSTSCSSWRSTNMKHLQ